ncbi:MAG: M48 family metalloprotease [Gammaproteobacteria bacterium]|nr:M48 family metalloprotease [Gammaproteobacteria bacterium]
MDFWARQADAHRRSRWLLLLFVLAVLAVVVAVNLVVLALLAASGPVPAVAAGGSWLTAHPRAMAITTLGVLAIIGISSLVKGMKLAGGGGAVARALGGQRVQADSTDPQERRLLHVVEEMAIASGLPVPAVYVLAEEPGINAFAAGHTPANAAITVTRGCLEHLDRAELQGVVGHEFSHILNGDMRLNIRLVSLLSGLLVLTMAGRLMQRAGTASGGNRQARGNGSLVVLGLALVAIGYVGVFFGRLIQAAVSRQREFLADAASVQFTRNPEGLRGALLKIGRQHSSRFSHPRGEEVAHMLFAPAMTRWFATHPPLAERIRALDGSFDPTTRLHLEVRPQPLGIVQTLDKPGLGAAFSDPGFLARQSIAVDPAGLRRRVGNPAAADIRHAAELAAALPGQVLAGNGTATAATALLFALVLDTAPAARAGQLERIRADFGTTLEQVLERQQQVLQAVPVQQRLALLGRIVPVLRQLPAATRRQILTTLAALARADGVISVFEYALGTLARVYLDETLGARRRNPSLRLPGALIELQLLFSALARHGHASEQDARQAYEQGMHHLGLPQPPPYRIQQGWSAGLDRALHCLDGLGPADKAQVVEALAITIIHDGRISLAEGELLRAICAALHCPLPPLRGG